MQIILRILGALIGLLGLVLIVLGVLFWTGHALALVNLHMLLGGIFVVCLWGAVACALRAGVRGSFVALVFVWSIIVPVFGVVQAGLLPGSWHWIIRVLHLVVGMLAIGLGQGLVKATRAAWRSGVRPASST